MDRNPCTKSQTDSKTFPTNSASCAKKRTFPARRGWRPPPTGSMRFSGPCTSRYRAASGARRLSPVCQFAGERRAEGDVPGFRRIYEISSVSSVASGGASRERVVFPAPETPANRKARPLRHGAGSVHQKPPCLASNSECRMRNAASIEYGLAVCRILRAASRIQFRAKVAALRIQRPPSKQHAQIDIGVVGARQPTRRHNLYLELEARLRARIHEPAVTLLQHPQEIQGCWCGPGPALRRSRRPHHARSRCQLAHASLQSPQSKQHPLVQAPSGASPRTGLVPPGPRDTATDAARSLNGYHLSQYLITRKGGPRRSANRRA